jgi:hypothetical protein
MGVVVVVLQALAVPAVRYAAVAIGVLAIAGLWLWRHDVRVAANATAAIEQKAEKNVQAADSVRAAVAAGARGLRDPHKRADTKR